MSEKKTFPLKQIFPKIFKIIHSLQNDPLEVWNENLTTRSRKFSEKPTSFRSNYENDLEESFCKENIFPRKDRPDAWKYSLDYCE